MCLDADLVQSRAVSMEATWESHGWGRHFLNILTCFSFFLYFFSDNSTEFWDTDIKWFSLLESSSWLDIIRYFFLTTGLFMSLTGLFFSPEASSPRHMLSSCSLSLADISLSCGMILVQYLGATWLEDFLSVFFFLFLCMLDQTSQTSCPLQDCPRESQREIASQDGARGKELG